MFARIFRILSLCPVCLFALGAFVLTNTSSAQEQELENTQELTSPLIPPEKAREMLRLPDGFTSTVFAAEPDVRQPISITTDARGRIWVAECITYAESKRNFDTRYNDRILIFEDTDGDGKADVRKVFWEGGKRLTSIEVGHGGVFVTCAPNFMFIPDADADDVPDGEPEILLDGWNSDFVRHNMVNGLKWGPDGWLYGRHGIQATSHVGPPGSTASQRTALNCCMWRFHPMTREFEVVCEGTTNPWGHDWDQHGELFMINTVIGHLWHVMPGNRFRRMYGSHFNPYTYEMIEQTADHFHFSGKEQWHDVRKKISDETDRLGGGHAHCGMMIYQGDNWPEKYRGGLFTANFHGRRLNMESLHRQGNGYVAKHEEDFMFSDDLWFRGVEMIYGPDGGVYVLDWSDIGECHEKDGIHRTSGRIYKITFGESKVAFQKAKAQTDFNLMEMTSEQLVKLLDHENQWFARTSRRLLQERAYANDSEYESVTELLQKRFEVLGRNKPDPPTVNGTLQTLWAYHAVTYGVDRGHVNENENESVAVQADPVLLSLIQNGSDHVRANAIKMLTDHPSDSIHGETFADLIKMAESDPSPLVRLHLASSMIRMGNPQRMSMARALSEYASDAGDRTQEKLIWYNVEPAVVPHWQTAIEVALGSKLPHLRRCIIRRLASEVSDHPEFVEAILERAPDSEENAIAILGAVREALAGRRQIEPPSNWEAVTKACEKFESTEIQQSLAFLGATFGSGLTIEQLKRIATNKNNDVTVRRQAIQAYAAAKPDGLFETLRRMTGDRAVTIQVVRSMGLCTEPGVPNAILSKLQTFDPATKRSAVTTLCSRPNWAKSLLNAIGNGQIQKNDLNAAHARQIKSHNDPSLDRLLSQHWGVVKDTSEELAATMQRIGKLVERTDIAPDLANGAKMFTQNCASCHVLFGDGGTRGPDLTGADRKNVAYLLENIVDPSSSVADTFRSSILLLEDGRTLVGVITEENKSTLKLLMVDEEVVIEVDAIEARRNTEKSLMPDGLLDKLSDQEIVDLFGHLRR